MQTTLFRNFAVLTVLIAMLGAGGCTTVVSEAAQKAWEDRSTADQVTDTEIAAGILKRLADRDNVLLLDVSTDVWEQRVMLTGTLDSASEKAAVEKLARSDKRIKQLYSHIKIVSKEARQERRKQASEKDTESKKGGFGQTVNDFWIETKIKAQLLTAKNVTSVNYRWRSVLNDVFIIGRAASEAERNKVLQIIRETEGVKSVQQHIQVKPPKK